MNDSNNIYDDYEKIGLTLKKLRRQAGMSQSKLADGICDRTTIVHLESGRAKQPSIVLLNQLCRRLSITLDDFFLIAYGGYVNQLWLKKNEIDALLKIREYKKAYLMAKKFFNESLHPVDVQYFGLIEGSYLYSLGKYEEAKSKYTEALCITCKELSNVVYTLTELRLLNGLICANFRIDGVLSTPETLNLIEIMNNSIYDYPMDRDYRVIISLLMCMSHYYFTLNMHSDAAIIINNAVEISNKYSCYDCLGHLWVILASCYTVLNMHDKAKEYYDKSNTFFKLFDEKEFYNKSIEYQLELYENINY